MGKTAITLALILFAASCQLAAAPTWYVDDSVAASGDGASWETAFKKVQQGIDAASHGDTVIVAEGLYVENIKFNGKNVIVTSTDPLNPWVVANTVIDGNNIGAVVTFSGTEDEACVLSGFTIRNGRTFSETGGGICGGDWNRRTRATIKNNSISGNSAVGAGSMGAAIAYCDGAIHNNRVTSNSNTYCALFACQGTIRNNVISQNLCTALSQCDGPILSNLIADNSGGGLSGCNGTIQGNTIAGNAAYGLVSCYGAIRCDGLILNNVIADNSGGGLSGCNGTIQGNTIVANAGYGLVSCYGAIRNCIIWGNADGESGVQVYSSNTPTYCCTVERIEAEGNISEDPLFVDAASGDYRLQAGSPCIDAGINYYWFAWPQRDLDGNCRLVGASVDMGCYEWGSFPDEDGDLLSDGDEWAAGTDPRVADSDGDGLRDGIELLRRTDPLTVTPPRDIRVPSDAFTIQEGLCLANDGESVIVSAGIYRGPLQFCGRDVILRSADPENADNVAITIIDGGLLGPVISFTGDESELCTLAGFTTRNGYAYYGAGICGGTRDKGTHATIRNNTIRDNTTAWEGDGGGLAFCDGTIRDNTIEGNTADGGGGLFDCNGVIESNTISGNLGIRGGGGLSYCDGPIQNNTISYNMAHRSGGGLDFCGGAIRNNKIEGNSAASWGFSSENWGGGLYGCDGMIEANTIVRNFADDDGGGLSACDGTIQNNMIRHNSAGGSGGGLSFCKATVQNNTITYNSAEQGGGLNYCDGTVRNNDIRHNSAKSGGGLFFCNGQVLNNTVCANEATENGGGLAFCRGTTAENVISDNSAESGGGLYSCQSVERNTICRNTARYGGGLAYCRRDESGCRFGLLRSNLITENSAEEGGGLYDCEYLIGNAIVRNSANGPGGGVCGCLGVILNCIIWGNTPAGAQLYDTVEPTYSCIEGWTQGGEGNIAGDPLFADPDGPDDAPWTFDDNDYRLLPDSPCIDAGKNEEWMWVAPDLDDSPRIWRGRDAWTADMGAYEYGSRAFTLGTVLELVGFRPRLTWNSRAGDSYTVWSCLDLADGSWDEETTVLSQGETTSWIDPSIGKGTQKFYRIEISR